MCVGRQRKMSCYPYRCPVKAALCGTKHYAYFWYFSVWNYRSRREKCPDICVWKRIRNDPRLLSIVGFVVLGSIAQFVFGSRVAGPSALVVKAVATIRCDKLHV